MHKLNNVYLAMLNNLWDIENQLILAMPKLIERAHSDTLKKALTDHSDETHRQKIRLEELLQHHGHSLTYERDMAFETMLKDATSDLSLIDDPDVKDAFIIASAQSIEHLEMSRYKTLIQWAKELDDTLGHDLLCQSVAEEEAISSALDSIAQGGLFSTGINQKASLTKSDPQ